MPRPKYHNFKVFRRLQFPPLPFDIDSPPKPDGNTDTSVLRGPPLEQTARLGPRRSNSLPHRRGSRPRARKGTAITALKTTATCFDAIVEASDIVIPREATAARPSLRPREQPPVYSRHDSVRHYRALPQASGRRDGRRLAHSGSNRRLTLS
jgi:hypothetical protein